MFGDKMLVNLIPSKFLDTLADRAWVKSRGRIEQVVDDRVRSDAMTA